MREDVGRFLTINGSRFDLLEGKSPYSPSILVAVMLLYLLWGVAGACLAVPIVAALRVLASRVSALEPLNIVLEE